MDIPTKGLKLIEEFEGFVSCPYWDSYGRVWTRGYGETEGISRNSRCLTRQEAENNLRNIFNSRYAYAINDLGVDLNENQFSALSSFIWNLGPGSMQWNVGRYVRAHEFENAANAMLEYDHAGGVVLQGLRTRRERERNLFLTPVKYSDPLNVLTKREHEQVNKYNKYIKHPHIHRRSLPIIKKELINFRKNIWEAAERGKFWNGKIYIGTRKGWNINNRRARYAILLKITTGR